MTTTENISFIIEEKEILAEEKKPNILEEEIILDELFSGSKKKKKKDKEKYKTEDTVENQISQITSEDQELLDMFDLKLKKRKKDKKEKDKEKDDILTLNKFSDNYEPPTYTYETLLNRLYTNFQDDNIHIVKTKNTLKLPIVHRISSKKTGWVNFKECCTSIGREQTNILNYLISELSTEANIDGNGVLLIRGIYNQKNIENVLRKFIINFVQCNVCKSLETNNKKDSNTRLNFLECSACKSRRSLPQIINGYKAGSKNKG